MTETFIDLQDAAKVRAVRLKFAQSLSVHGSAAPRVTRATTIRYIYESGTRYGSEKYTRESSKFMLFEIDMYTTDEHVTSLRYSPV